MRTRHAFLALIAATLVCSFGIATGVDALVSGPQVGRKLPGGFSPVNVTNAELPDYAGKRSDYTEQHGAGPVVLVFGRGIAGTAEKIGPKSGPQPAKEPTLIAKPDAFKPLFSPDCSHCKIENIRRIDDLRADDRVLCFRQVFNDGYTNDGGIPVRFFLNAHRVLSDSWGVFVYDPDAGYARGFRPEGKYTFYGWRNGVMVMKGHDGTLYSCLTGIAFQGPKKGTRLEPRATLVSEWGFWHKRYPQAMAFTMFEQYKPVELPTELNEDSVKSRGPADKRLPADTPVLGVWDGKQARAYPLDVLKKAGVVHEPGRVVFWYEPTRTAAAYRLPTFGDWTFSIDAKDQAAPFVDKRTEGRWDITGRGIGGGPMLPWLDAIEVKWLAWAAEYPGTSIYGKDSLKSQGR